jgi:hypothetical protein
MVRGETPTLYTSVERDGALAEITFHWGRLVPVPSKPVVLHRIHLGTKKSMRLARADLTALGVDWERYATIGYVRTQEIGAAVAHLQCDGLIVPSARWHCENVMVFFSSQRRPEEVATLLTSEETDWREWARSRGLVISST